MKKVQILIRPLYTEKIARLQDSENKYAFEVYDIACITLSPEILSTTSLADRLIDPNEGVLNIVI